MLLYTYELFFFIDIGTTILTSYHYFFSVVVGFQYSVYIYWVIHTGCFVVLFLCRKLCIFGTLLYFHFHIFRQLQCFSFPGYYYFLGVVVDYQYSEYIYWVVQSSGLVCSEMPWLLLCIKALSFLFTVCLLLL